MFIKGLVINEVYAAKNKLLSGTQFCMLQTVIFRHSTQYFTDISQLYTRSMRTTSLLCICIIDWMLWQRLWVKVCLMRLPSGWDGNRFILWWWIWPVVEQIRTKGVTQYLRDFSVYVTFAFHRHVNDNKTMKSMVNIKLCFAFAIQKRTNPHETINADHWGTTVMMSWREGDFHIDLALGTLRE